MPKGPNAPNRVHREADASAGTGSRSRRPRRRPGSTADIVLVRNASVLARTIDHLRLHPQRAGFSFRMPERLPARAPRTRSTAWNCFHGSSPLRDATKVKPQSPLRPKSATRCGRSRAAIPASPPRRAHDQVLRIELAEERASAIATARTRRRCGTAASRGFRSSRRNCTADRYRPKSNSCIGSRCGDFLERPVPRRAAIRAACVSWRRNSSASCAGLRRCSVFSFHRS